MVDEILSDTVGAGNAATGNAQLGGQPPSMLAGTQYVKSVSFSIPGAPGIHASLDGRPHIALNIDVTARQLADGKPNFEVILVMHCQSLTKAPNQENPSPTVIYEANIHYAGLFALQNATPESIEPLLLVEAPRLLFPAARNFLADLSREAGFVPTMIQSVDFAELWRQRRIQQ